MTIDGSISRIAVIVRATSQAKARYIEEAENATRALDVHLQIGTGTETVQVEGGYDLVQVESSGNFGAQIDGITMSQLPIVGSRGRNPLG